METDLLPNVRGNVQTLRNMWSTKAQEDQKLLKPKPVTYRSHSQLPQKSSPQIEIQSSISMNETIIHKETKVTFSDEKPFICKPIEQSPSVNDTDEFSSLPPPPPSIVFKEQAQSVAILKQSVTKMLDLNKKKTHFADVKKNGIRHWHIARHVFRSGLIFGPSRRASDSIVPLLMKTHIAQHRSRADTLDSIHAETPFENLIDYLTYNNKDNNMNIPEKKSIIKRTISDTAACINRNKLNDTIAQYEKIMRHLKNYDKFRTTYPVPSPVPAKRKSIITEPIINKNEGNIQQILTAKSSTPSRHTQSLARSVGRTFTEFIMSDLLLSPLSKASSNEQRRLSTSHAASQTDLTELMEETKEVLNELDIVINNTEEKVSLTPNSEINVIVVNPPVIQKEEVKTQPKEKPLIQRLFEGKKTAYTSDDINMESIRIPEELMGSFEIAKKKCFFPTEELIYATKMIKIDRRGYKQHIRMLCITSERLYIITKKDPYPKEAVMLKDILNISCTPYKDGFICLHTRETREDRGDWIFILDHPCEFLTQLFMVIGRSNNNSQFLKIRTNFHHTRRSIATLADDCLIEARLADTFRIAFENYEVLAIYTP